MATSQLSPRCLLAEFAGNLEKKQRNLLKRKLRLDTYSSMRAKGETLNSDQEKALLDYDMVSCSVTVIKEMVDGLAELQVKLDEAFVVHEKETSVRNEEFAVDSLQRLSAIWGLLSKLQSPIVKAAIIKASSSQQFIMLDNLTKMINMPLPEPKDSTAFSEEFDALLKSNAFKEQASILLGLALGRPVPISNAKGSKLRGQTFEDIRTLCLHLLSNLDVRNALSMPFTEPVIPKKKTAPRASEPPVKQNASVTQPRQIKPEPVNIEPPVSRAPEHEFLNNAEADVILSTVLNPLKTNFNFLQDSHVGPSSSSAVSSLVPQPPISMTHAIPQVHENIQHHNQRMPRMDSEIPQGIPLIKPTLHQPQREQSRQLETTRREHEILPQQFEMLAKRSDKPNEVFIHSEPVTQPISHGTQQTPAPVEDTQHPEQMQPSLENTEGAKQPEKPADSLKKSKAKRGKTAPPAEPSSKAAIVSEEHHQEEVKPSKPKTWADLVRGSAVEPLSSPPSQSPVFEQISTTETVSLKSRVLEDEVAQDHHGQRPVYGRENGSWAPRGGFRGGRGRGAGPGFRGGRGRGNMRGSFQANNQRGDFQNARPSQIQSTC
uniref:Caprin-1 n=1 Tax=Schistocephalus solidus TaxID=70667 RepID=A0A0X3Q4Y1_SCHSO